MQMLVIYLIHYWIKWNTGKFIEFNLLKEILVSKIN